MRISDWSSDVCSPDLSCAIVNVVARPRLPDVVTQFRQALLQVSNLGMQAWRGERAGQQMQPRPRVGLLRQCDQCARGFAPGRYFAVLQHGLRAIRIPDVEHRCLRPEERRVGKECGSQGRSQGSPANSKKKIT